MTAVNAEPISPKFGAVNTDYPTVGQVGPLLGHFSAAGSDLGRTGLGININAKQDLDINALS